MAHCVKAMCAALAHRALSPDEQLAAEQHGAWSFLPSPWLNKARPVSSMPELEFEARWTSEELRVGLASSMDTKALCHGTGRGWFGGTQWWASAQWQEGQLGVFLSTALDMDIMCHFRVRHHGTGTIGSSTSIVSAGTGRTHRNPLHPGAHASPRPTPASASGSPAGPTAPLALPWPPPKATCKTPSSSR
jgi:hypothetical protein